MYLLDTNICIEILRNRNSPVISRLKAHHPSDIYLCSIVKAQLFYGARKSTNPAKNIALVRAFCDPLPSLNFDDKCAETYGVIRADLEASGMVIGANDLLIAAIAKNYDMILVTHNTREFIRIQGLQVEDWIKEPGSPPS